MYSEPEVPEPSLMFNLRGVHLHHICDKVRTVDTLAPPFHYSDTHVCQIFGDTFCSASGFKCRGRKRFQERGNNCSDRYYVNWRCLNHLGSSPVRSTLGQRGLWYESRFSSLPGMLQFNCNARYHVLSFYFYLL